MPVKLSKVQHNKHQQYLANLPKLAQSAQDVITLYSPRDFRTVLLEKIATAVHRICLVMLYLENDEAGNSILTALYAAKRARPELDISLFVDWHRAQRGRIGAAQSSTNADWYRQMAEQYPGVNVPIFGVPVNTREALGVLHLKGFIIDDDLIYSGASLNNVYLHQHDKYRYDRYHIIHNKKLADAFFETTLDAFTNIEAVSQLNQRQKKPKLRRKIREFRQNLRAFHYPFSVDCDDSTLGITPLAGLGRYSALNKTLQHLILSSKKSVILCTPYFNLPVSLARNIISLLRQGKTVEIIVGDKTANDFYVPEDQSFRAINALPYLYEINLRRFLSKLQRYVDDGYLQVRLWKDNNNSFHLKGLWVDKEWVLITGNNFNPRAWRLDLENAVLFHDPQQQLASQCGHELSLIRRHTAPIRHFSDLDNVIDYPPKVRKLIRRLLRIRVVRLINQIL